jgi:hypothetical protein
LGHLRPVGALAVAHQHIETVAQGDAVVAGMTFLQAAPADHRLLELAGDVPGAMLGARYRYCILQGSDG